MKKTRDRRNVHWESSSGAKQVFEVGKLLLLLVRQNTLKFVGHSGALKAMLHLVNSFPDAGGTRVSGRQCRMGRDLLQSREKVNQ